MTEYAFWKNTNQREEKGHLSIFHSSDKVKPDKSNFHWFVYLLYLYYEQTKLLINQDLG